MKTMISLTIAAVLTGCAGSANHRVVSPHQASDAHLSCPQIEYEMQRAQHIIDAVDQDKNDVTGADVVDGLLYFPFNLIAKHGNYSDAVNAASARISRLQYLAREKGCDRG